MKKILSVVIFSAVAFSSSVFAADTSAKTTSPGSAIVASAKPAEQQDIININTADAQTLTKLKGVGAKKADAIVAWRKANGNFKTVDQLVDVKGIGTKIVDANRKNLRI